MTLDEQALEQRFQQALQRDAAKAPDWMVRWDYQRILAKRKRNYEDGVVNDFLRFGGAEDLVKWMNWFRQDYPDFVQDERIAQWVKVSRANDERVLRALGLTADMSVYDRRVGLNNAHDLLFPLAIPVPVRNRITTVLDLGAGYGRQANLWTTQVSGMRYIGMDAIVNSYCLQHLYYKALSPGGINDYIDEPERFSVREGINHLPTWRTDLLADDSVDLVMCVQVLPELNARLVAHLIGEFRRMLKPGGALYIRDHGYTWKPTGRFDVERHLAASGFDLEYKAHVINDVDIHGIPRIWRKTDPRVRGARTRTMKHRVDQAIIDIDTITGGRFKRAARKLKGKA